MAYLQYSYKEKGFYASVRRDLDLGWTFFDDNGRVIGRTQSEGLTSYEKVLIKYRSLNPRKRKRRRLNLK